jgi:hypothetical protein
MGFWKSFKGWVRRESSDLREATDELEQRLDGDLSRREGQLEETPEEAMARIQAEIERSDSSLGELGDRIGRAAARADATTDLSDGPAAPGDAEPADRGGRPPSPPAPSGEVVDADGIDPDDLDRAPDT